MEEYKEFIKKKQEIVQSTGFSIDREELNPILFEFQKDLVLWSISLGKSAIFAMTGHGKCHGKGTKIIMYDGSVKNVENIQKDERLMGDDSTPRKVLSTCKGQEKLYKIHPKKGDSFICNESHILSLIIGSNYGKYKKGDIYNISIKEYMEMSKSFKHVAKLYKKEVTFSNDYEFDNDKMYFSGLWLGDGTYKSASIATKDDEIIDFLNHIKEKTGAKSRTTQQKGCILYSFSTIEWSSHTVPVVKKWTDELKRNDEKYIPHKYLTSSKENRLHLLAGLLDTDGHLFDNCYEIVTKYKTLSDNIIFLARSLGLSASHGIKHVKDYGNYHRICISGNTDIIPCRVGYKKATKRKQIKNNLVCGFELEDIGVGAYYGFTLDKNHLYLLGDFTVTHNTLMEIEFARQVNKKYGYSCLLVTPLAVSEQTIREGRKYCDLEINNFRKNGFKEGLNIVNYEYLDHIDASLFDCVVLDESSRLKSFTAETTKKSIAKFSHCPYKLLATATPAPNDYMELGTSAEFLDVMTRREMLSTFFIHDSGETSQWRLKKHAESVFWEWVASWGAVVTKPSDLGYDDGGFILPELKVNEIIVETNHKFGGGFFGRRAETLPERREARKVALPYKIDRIVEEINNSDDIILVWCDLNVESEMLAKRLNDSVEIAGRHSNEYKETEMLKFAEGKTKTLITKAKIAGHGLNWQVCHKMYFIGLSDSFEQFFQAVRRCYRFGQTEPVEVNIISSDIEGATLENIKRKEKNANRMLRAMVKKTNKYVRENVGSIKRLSKRYFPTVDMIVPEWLKEEQ